MLANHLTGQPVNHPSWLQKPSNWKPQSFQNLSQEASWRGLGGVSWGGLGGSWGVLAPLGGVLGVLASRWLQELKTLQNLNVGFPFWGPCWGPKSIKIGLKSDPKSDHFFDCFLDRLVERFGANLAPSWTPKPSQNGAKLAPKSSQVGVLI